MKLNKPTEQQLEIICQQLGREPRGLAGIAVQSDEGIPLVLQMDGLVDDKPFPTLFWLSSKDIYQAIAEIETADRGYSTVWFDLRACASPERTRRRHK